jgi:mannosyl-3-phosphoglycerate phosphatase
LFEQAHGALLTVGLGDSLNDLPMLEAVALPVLVRRPDGRHDPELVERLPHARLADGIGPRAWQTEVMKILEETGRD